MTQPSPDPGTADRGTADTGIEPTHLPTSRISRWQMVVGGLGLVVLLWVGTQMYDVVSATGGGGDHNPGGPDPGQDQPVEDQDDEIDPDEDDVHDPSQFDHG